MPNSTQSLDIGKNSDGRISDLWISGQSLMKVNCRNSRTSDVIDIKFGPVTKLDKRNNTASKIFDNDVLPANYDVIIIFQTYDQFEAFINSHILSYKTWKQN